MPPAGGVRTSLTYRVSGPVTGQFYPSWGVFSPGQPLAPIAQADDGVMQQGYWYTANRHFGRLEDPASVGLIAAQRALRRLGSRKIGGARRIPRSEIESFISGLAGQRIGA